MFKGKIHEGWVSQSCPSDAGVLIFRESLAPGRSSRPRSRTNLANAASIRPNLYLLAISREPVKLSTTVSKMNGSNSTPLAQLNYLNQPSAVHYYGKKDTMVQGLVKIFSKGSLLSLTGDQWGTYKPSY